MKLIHAFVLNLLICGVSTGIEFPTPKDNAKPGDLVTTASVVAGRDTDIGTLTVPEDWDHPSKLIHLPVVVVHSQSPTPAEPVFILHGGPGMTNIKPEDGYEWALAKRDVVLIGYRGVDGSVKLTMPELKDFLKTTPDPLSTESLKKAAQILDAAVDRFDDDGIVVAHYNLDMVVADIEAAAQGLGVERINVSGGSYGGAVACYYSLCYPDRVRHCAMIEAAFPWNIGVAEPESVDARLQKLNAQWKRTPANLAHSKDIVATIRFALATLPKTHDGVLIDRGTMRLMTYFSLYTKERTEQLFDAFVAAEQGDYGQLAQMDQFWNQVVDMFNWGDLSIKTFSSHSGPPRDYLTEMNLADSIIGSPLTQLGWGMHQLSSLETKPLKFPAIQDIPVKTLLVYGNEHSAAGRKRRLRHFPEGRLETLKDLGHLDVWDQANKLQQAFFDER